VVPGGGRLQEELIPGTYYVLESKKADKMFALFKRAMGNGNRGLCVSLIHPDQLMDDFGIEPSDVLWLSSASGPRNINPQSIAILTDMLVRFLEKGPEAIVAFDGVEYLVMQNDFARVLRLINFLYETVAVSHNILIVTLDPRSFSPKELAYIEKDAEIVRESDQPSETGE
jgi:hypothetical protein